MIHYNAFGDIIKTNKIIEKMDDISENNKNKEKLENLNIDGNLKMTGKIIASSYGTINTNKICIGDTCLTKEDLDKLINFVKK